MSQQKESRHARRAVTAAVVTSMMPVAGHAATAARVSFAIGDVTSIDPAGTERALSKGAVIREGDTVRTTRGRAQLRFTDGSRTALLPNTEFKVNEYRFEGQEDEGSRSFFSLVKGGLRTITGAIGKLRKRSYRLSTPVATIGIRGTEYLIVLGNSGDLRVGAGEVVASNEAGEFFCSGFCYVPDDQSPMRQVEDQPIYLAPPLDRPRGPEEAGSSGDGSMLAGGGNVTAADPNGSISPSSGAINAGFDNGKLYTVAVAYGDDTEGSGSSPFVRGKTDLVDVTFNAAGGMERFVDGPVSATNSGATVTDVGTAGTTSGGAVVGWSRWTGDSYIATGDSGSGDNPYGLSSCSSPCDPETRGLSNGRSHHQVVIIPPADEETMAQNTVYVFALAGATTPTLVNGPSANPAVDGVSGGALAVFSNDNQVQLTGMSVTAGSGSLNYFIPNASGSFDPAENYTFSLSGAVTGGMSSSSVSMTGGLSTGFTHAGAAYKITDNFSGNKVVGSTAWQQVAQEPDTRIVD